MTLVEVKGDLGMATLVPGPDLIQAIFSLFGCPPPHQTGIFPVLIKNSGGLPVDVMVRFRLVLGDSRGFATGCGGFIFHWC